MFADFRSYNRGADRQRTRDDDYFVTKDYYQYDNSNGVTSGQPDNSDWFVEKSGPMEEYQNLRDDLPVHDAGHNRRGHNNGGALPPSNTENWDKTNYVKHGLERGSNEKLSKKFEDNFKSIINDYKHQFKSKQYIQQDPRYHISHSVGDQRESLQTRHHVLNSDSESDKSRQFRASKKENVYKSSKKSVVVSSDLATAASSDKRIPPVPLSRETAPDPSSFQGNHLQTEKQAAGERTTDMKAGEGKVMVKGKVKPVKADIDQGPNPEKTYKRVEDFFQSQRESSIVEVPNAVKKEEASKLYKDNFIPVKDAREEVDKEQGESF